MRFFSGEGGNGCFCFLCFLEPPRLSASGDRARTGDRTLGGEAPRAFAGDRTFRGEAGFVATGADLRLGSSIPRYPSSADRSREPWRRMGSPHLSNSTLGSRLFPESLDRRRSLSLLRSLSRPPPFLAPAPLPPPPLPRASVFDSGGERCLGGDELDATRAGGALDGPGASLGPLGGGGLEAGSAALAGSGFLPPVGAPPFSRLTAALRSMV